MTPAEQIFDRIAVAMERQATAQERIADILDGITNLPGEEDSMYINLRADEPEGEDDPK